MTSVPVLLTTCDDELLGDVLRLAAAAGSTLEVAHDPASALRSWTAAPVVLVGADQAARIGELRPPRRDGVHLVGRAPIEDRLFRDAVAAGAGGVVELPAAEARLVQLLADVADGPVAEAAPVVGLVAGSGGAGASTFAAALALAAARTRPVVLVDLDPWGPGLDRILGLEDAPGVRWDALADGDGRLGSQSLRESLPRRDGVALLAWGPSGATPAAAGNAPPAHVVSEVLSAAQRGSGLVVVDLQRSLHGVAAEAATRCTAVLVVCEASVGSALAAAKVAARVRALQRHVGLVVRGAGGVPADRVAEVLAIPLLAEYVSRRRVAEDVELGLGPVRGARSPLARAAKDVAARLSEPWPELP